MKRLAILGSTGSIGTQTLDVVRRASRDLRVVALAGGANAALLAKQIAEFRPERVAVANPVAARRLAERFPDLAIDVGEAGVIDIATFRKADLVVSTIAGVAGLAPTLAAIESGHDVALANKESLVLAGRLVMRSAKKHHVDILPVDSEHSGVAELLRGRDIKDIRRVILTASGGALRDTPFENIKTATREEVLAHPNWSMGAKVTVDSATLANKAFEIIEAHHLFGIPFEKIEAVIHPQSIVHAMIEWADGSLTAQLAHPDMRLPIQLALGLRTTPIIPRLGLTRQPLDFRPVDARRYPLFDIILNAARASDAAGAVAALACERATERFLGGDIAFADIASTVTRSLKQLTPSGSITSVRQIVKLTTAITAL